LKTIPASPTPCNECWSAEGHDVEIEKRGDDGLARAVKEPFNVVITDLKLPGLNGLELVRQLHAAKPRLPIILITAFGTTETAIEAMKFGAYDYLLKPFEHSAIDRTGSQSRRQQSPHVRTGRPGRSRPKDATRSSAKPAMQKIYKEIGRVAAKPVSILIRGETGTGKELIARALYQHSDRANAPFIAINCAAIPETLAGKRIVRPRTRRLHRRGRRSGSAGLSRRITARFFWMKLAT
jgi:DNA-binding NtrC family response regulator